MAGPHHDAEAMMDEVALLEQALREAVERRRTGASVDAGLPTAKPPFDTALATYALQLRAWIDLQVDARLDQTLPGILEGELAAARQDAATAVEVSEHCEGELRAVTEAQAKLLALVEGVSRELERTKAAVNALQIGAQVQSVAAGREASSLALGRDETLASLEKVRDKLEEMGRTSRDRVDELARSVEDVARSSRERIEDLARNCSRDNDAATTRFAQLEEAFSQVRRSGERHDASLATLQRLQQEIALEGRRVEGLEREVAAANAGRVDAEARLDARVEALRLEVAGMAGARSELESCVNRRSVEIDSRVESLIEGRLEAWQFDGKLESRLGGLRAELEERLDSQSRVRLEAFRLESKQEFMVQLADLQDRIESHFRKTMEAVRLEGRQELRDHVQDSQERIEAGFRRCLEALQTETGEELKLHLEKSQTRLGEDLVALQQRLVTELRAETTAALSRESAAIAALDEQLWITDQRLGQRIDELAHQHFRERLAIPERAGGVVESSAAKQRQAAHANFAEPRAAMPRAESAALSEEHSRQISAVFQENMALRGELQRVLELMTGYLAREKALHDMLDNLSTTYTQATASLHATQSQYSAQAQQAVQSHDAQRKQLADPMNDTASEVARIQRMLANPPVSPPSPSPHLHQPIVDQSAALVIDQQRPRRTSIPVVGLAPQQASSQHTLFDSVDKNHDGIIDRAEFRAAFGPASARSPTPTPTQVGVPMVNVQPVALQPMIVPGSIPVCPQQVAMAPPPPGMRTPPPPMVRYVA